MENNFDKIFKDKLEHRKFEMKPEYWEGAEALIAADEKSGNWRRFFIWFSVALVAGLSVFFIWKNDHSTQIVEAEKTSNTTFGNVQTPMVEKEKSEFEISNDKISEGNISEEKNRSTEINENNNSENKLASTLAENKQSKIITSDLKNTKQLNQDSKVFPKTIPSNPTKDNLATKNNSNELENNNTTPTFISGEENQSIPPVGITDEKSTEKENEGKLLPIIPTEIPSTKNEQVKKEDETVVQPIASPSTILLPFLEMFLANNKKIEELDLEAVCPFTPQRNKFAFGGFAGAVGYPLVDNNNSETPFIGFKTGLIIERNFEIGKAKMALGAELAYHFRSGNFEATKQNEGAKYSFGKSVAQAKLTPENLHYFELPIYLKYQKKRMTLETGASFNYLFGVKGKVTEVDETTQSGWVPSLGFKKSHVNVLLGAHYRLSDNIHFGVRANYTPGGILDKGASLPNGMTVALQESKPFYVTVRITQYLNLKK